MSPFKRNIGITIGDPEKFWTNGLDQNSYFLAKLLSKHYDIALFGREEGTVREFKTYKYNDDMMKRCDVVIQPSLSLPEDLKNKRREDDVKFVTLHYGNTYETYLEDIIYLPDEKKRGFGFAKEDTEGYWMSPHFMYFKGLYDAIYDCDVKEAPYVWDPCLFDEKTKQLQEDDKGALSPHFDDNNDLGKITIFEPNISHLKNCIIPMSIVSALWREKPELIKTLNVMNAKHLGKKRAFAELIVQLGFEQRLKDKTFEVNDRRTTPFMLGKKYTGTAVFHQHNCELNYLYLEMMYTNMPFVHNSEPFKEAGYYYEGHDAMAGKEQLKKAITTHRLDLKQYEERSKEILWKHSIENPKNLAGYVALIEELF